MHRIIADTVRLYSNQNQGYYGYDASCSNHVRRKCDPDPIGMAIRRYTYAVAIAGRYGWKGLGQGMGCEWLAGLVWEGLGGLGMGCEWLAGLVSRACLYVDCTDGRGWEVWG